MPTRREIEESYFALRLPFGEPPARIEQRYKLLLRLLRQDANFDTDMREEALASLNNHLRTLEEHFQSDEHSHSSNCLCLPIDTKYGIIEQIETSYLRHCGEDKSASRKALMESAFLDQKQDESQKLRWDASVMLAIAFLATTLYSVGGRAMVASERARAAREHVSPFDIKENTEAVQRVRDHMLDHQPVRVPGQAPSGPSIHEEITDPNQLHAAIKHNNDRLERVMQQIGYLRGQLKIATIDSAHTLTQEIMKLEHEQLHLESLNDSLRKRLHHLMEKQTETTEH